MADRAIQGYGFRLRPNAARLFALRAPFLSLAQARDSFAVYFKYFAMISSYFPFARMFLRPALNRSRSSWFTGFMIANP